MGQCRGIALLAASLLVLNVAACSRQTAASAGPSVAKVRPVVDDYHGTKITDPYRYFEDLKDPQTQAWMKAQADYAQRRLLAIPGRDAILQRIRELDSGQPFHLFVTRRWPNGDLHYHKRLAS